MLTSIFADVRFFLMTLFSEYCSVAMMACATAKGKIGSREQLVEDTRYNSEKTLRFRKLFS